MKRYNLVIPAAGDATRLRPLSTNTSKAMVRVNGKPCLDYILESAKKYGELNKVIVVDGKFEDIRNYCKIKHPNIEFVQQTKLDGPRHAIELGLNYLQTFNDSDLPVVVWLGDAIILESLLPIGKDFLLTKSVNTQKSWCMWDGKEFYDKPTQHVNNSHALVGLYSFKSGSAAIKSFSAVGGYDISVALMHYGANKFDNVITDSWYDIGELSSFYKTSATLLDLKAREFNNIKYDKDLGVISKYPNYHDADSIDILKTEKNWYTHLTYQQSAFVPRIFNTDSTGLTMSYESGTLLSDMMLYDNLTETTWEYIINKVIDIKLKYFNNNCKDDDFIDQFHQNSSIMWRGKTSKRLEAVDFPVEISKEIHNMAKRVHLKSVPISGLHGDLHFGNILYNSHIDQLRFIDPRGKYGKHTGVYGDNIYDFAKLAHDIIHGYSSMLANVKFNDNVKSVFINVLEKHKLDVQLISDAGIVLLASCIPLHYDDVERQQRFKNKVIDYVTKR